MAQFITDDIVLAAAQEHAKLELGKHYEINPEAAKSIGTDFICGIKWTLNLIRKDPEIFDHVDRDLEFEK